MPRLALLAVLFLCSAVFADENPRAPAKKPLLPGAQADGSIQLPNTWSLRPAGRQVTLGDFPVAMALHPSGKWLAILHAGHGEHEIILVALQGGRERIVSRVHLEQTFGGIAFAPDGNTLYAGGGEFEVVHVFNFQDGFLTAATQLRVAGTKFVPGALAVHPRGHTLYVPGVWGHAVSVLPAKNPEKRLAIPLEKESYPYACLVDSKAERLYVSLWAKAAVAVINLADYRLVQTIPTERHPTEMIFGPQEKTLYVACSNSTRVSVLSVLDGKGLETINCALYPDAPSGNTPNSISMTPDGQLLFVTNANANNVAVFHVGNPGNAKPLGFIPVGMYPTCVRYNPADKRLYVANGRGTSPKANPHGPNPLLLAGKTIREYIADLYQGTLTSLPIPTAEQMVKYSKQAYLCSPLREDQGVVGAVPMDSPIPARVGAPSPIKYCVYIVRENRTYDQVLGDMKEGNGDPNLCIFPEKVTPNAHRLARQFVLLDNFYCDGEVSAEGHEWSMGAYCSDFVRKVWPISYRGGDQKRMNIYPAEGNFDEVARPAGGYLWDRCLEAKVTFRNYGEWVNNGRTLTDPERPRVKALEGHTDPWYRGFDLNYSDFKRADRFIVEWQRLEKEGDMPRLSIVRLGNDHTMGMRAGKKTPTAMVAENDLALGRIMEAISRSSLWKETAVFVVEDDAQNGADHVDAHRSIALVVSPYTQHGKVDSTMYSTSAVLRTMELILGLKPMSQFDAAARPLVGAFQAMPDTTGYRALLPLADMNAVNVAGTWGAKMSESFDFTKEDAVDDLIFNEVIWRSVRGMDSRMPPPVHAAFVFPHLGRD